MCCSATSSIRPRGRIYLIKDMLENDRPATAEVVKHIDRCLSCLACMTTCPSGVHYMHLVDHARAHIEETYRRPWPDRAMRALLAGVLPYPAGSAPRSLPAGSPAPLVGWRPGCAARSLAPQGRAGRARLARPRCGAWSRCSACCRRGCRTVRPTRGRGVFPPQGARKGRVALLQGCAQPVLAPSINEAAIRLLTRHGIEVVLAAGEGCCGSLVHHMGREAQALAQARANIDAWTREIEDGGLDAILITASGCGTTIKDYGFMLRDDPAYAEKAARVVGARAGHLRVSRRARPRRAGAHGPARRSPTTPPARCSTARKSRGSPRTCWRAAGFAVRDVARGASVLRLGRHLQHAAARHRRARCATARSRRSSAPAPT